MAYQLTRAVHDLRELGKLDGLSRLDVEALYVMAEDARYPDGIVRLSTRRLAARVRCSQSASSRIIRRLEAAGLVQPVDPAVKRGARRPLTMALGDPDVIRAELRAARTAGSVPALPRPPKRPRPGDDDAAGPAAGAGRPDQKRPAHERLGRGPEASRSGAGRGESPLSDSVGDQKRPVLERVGSDPFMSDSQFRSVRNYPYIPREEATAPADSGPPGGAAAAYRWGSAEPPQRAAARSRPTASPLTPEQRATAQRWLDAQSDAIRDLVDRHARGPAASSPPDDAVTPIGLPERRLRAAALLMDLPEAELVRLSGGDAPDRHRYRRPGPSPRAGPLVGVPLSTAAAAAASS